MLNDMTVTIKKLTKTMALLIVLVLPFVLWLQRWNLYDAWRLRDYNPPRRIVQLADDTQMNDQARRLFYVYHPELNDKNAFNANCMSSERTIVLGCYVGGTGIYLYNVTDERLAGIIEVTAAHEMLHAAYERMGSGEKAKVNAMLERAYDQVTNKRIRDTIDDYRKNGASVPNELHSILGTEVRELPAELEDYYKRFFTDRLAVVGFSEKYEQAFTQRKEKVAQYDAQLEVLKDNIDNGQQTLAAQSQALETERARLQALLAAKNYEAYNAGVNGYNNQVNAYNTQVRTVRGYIDEYNAIVAARNAIATEESELVKAIDSRPTTIETQ